MAQQGVQVDQETSCSSACQDPSSGAVSGPGSGSPCGHGYSRRFTDQHRTQEHQRGTSGSPQCTTRTKKNKKNTELLPAESPKNNTEVPDVPLPDRTAYAGPGDVACASCTGRSLKAMKTCLQCLVSYCDAHLRPHYHSPAFKKHKLVDVSGASQLRENIFCSRHDEEKKVFCRTDLQCICYLCSMDTHKGHDTVSVATERAERQKELGESRQKLQHRIQEREENAKALQREVESINHCADRALEDSDAIFDELVSSVERRRTEVRRLIREQQGREASRAEERRRRAEREVAELRTRHAELERLELTEDHVHFLHAFGSLPAIAEVTHPAAASSHSPPPLNPFGEGAHPESCSPPLSLFDGSSQAASSHSPPLSLFASNSRDILQVLGTHVSESVNRVHAFLSTSPPPHLPPPHHPEPRTRAEFLQYSRPIALDPNTAEAHLCLSRGNRKVTRTLDKQSYPHHPERFTKCRQVLSGEALSGRCYWEVSWTGYNVYIAVSYRDVSRTGLFNESGFGYNDRSWSLQCYDEEYVFRHANVGTRIPGPVCSRVGVYLDHGAGLLSFYGVMSDTTMTLLHRVRAAFTHDLHTGFYVSRFIGATAELCDLR